MKHTELVIELASRAGVSRADAGAMLDALRQIASEQAQLGNDFSILGPEDAARATADILASVMGAEPRRPVYADSGAPLIGMTPYVPSADEIDDLIAAAAAHPLGIEFLLNGQVGAVAVTFTTHAFTVEAARQRLAAGAAAAGPAA